MAQHFSSENRNDRGIVEVTATSRRKCHCCGNRATHVGTAQGAWMILGCFFIMRRWVRQGSNFTLKKLTK